MATAIQVTGTGFDSNVWALVPDNDGTTCWAFNDTSVGNTVKYARFSLVDGSIVQAGGMFGGSGRHLRSRTDAAVYWAQSEDASLYYTISPNPSTGHTDLIQFAIVPSAGVSSVRLLDNYSLTINTLDLNTAGLPAGTHLCAFDGSDGVHYVAVMGSTLWVVNADTWTVVGSISPDGSHSPATAISGQSCFVDKNGDLWGITLFNQSGGFMQMFYWHPADGATAGVLNATLTEVPYPSGLTTSNIPSFFHYVSSNHSILIASEFGAVSTFFTSDLYNVALGTPGSAGTFTTNASLPSDGALFINTFNYAYDATDMEMTVTQPSGKLAIQSDTSGTEFNTQVGGIINLLDPVALTIDSSATIDITQFLLGTALPAPTQGTYDASHGTGTPWYNQFADMVYSETNNTLAVTYAQTDFSTGSALYLVTFAAVTPPPTPSLYQSAGGFTSTAVEHKSDASADNLEVTHFLSSDLISEADLRAGLYDFAEIELRIIDWEHPEYGSLKLLKGTLGQVTIKNGLAHTELRGLTQKLSTGISSTTGPVCRAEVFDGKLADSDPVSNPGSRWRCNKSPVGFTFTNSVASSPDSITIVPNDALTFPSLAGSSDSAITLGGVAVSAYFTTHGSSGHGAFDLQYGGTVGNPTRFGSSSAVPIVQTGTGNSLNFNGGTKYAAADVPVISPINWATIDNGGHVLSWAQPWTDATENYNMMVTGQFFVPAAMSVTFQIAHDDGIMWAIIPTLDHAGDVVTVTSGPICPPLNQATNPLNQTRTAYNGYSFGQYTDTGGFAHGSGAHYVAADNRQGNRTQNWTVHFPAAGTYDFEFDFSNFEHRQQMRVLIVGQDTDIAPGSLGSAGTGVSGWYDNGRITFTSGIYKDRTFDIQTVETVGSPPVEQIKLFAGSAMPSGAPTAGDTFIIQTGCNNLTSDCFLKYHNIENFQGENQMPGNFVLLATPDLH